MRAILPARPILVTWEVDRSSFGDCSVSGLQIHDKTTPWKSFLVIVDGSPKNDDGHKTEQPDEEYATAKLSDKLLSFAENGHFHNLATVQGSVPPVHEDRLADPACKSDGPMVSQDTLLATAISELSELTPQADPGPEQLHSLTSME